MFSNDTQKYKLFHIIQFSVSVYILYIQWNNSDLFELLSKC